MLGVTGTRQARLGLAPKPAARMSDARDRRGRLVRSRAFNESKNFFGGNGDEFFENEWSASLNHEKEPEEIIHIFTRELDIVTLGPRRGKLIGEEFESNFGTLEGPLPSVEEQGLCIGATFGIKAFSVDPSRQISVLGFCRCIHTLGWHVNEAVLSKGGVVTDSSSSMSTDSLHEKLVMTVQVPYLFGVPQEWDAISEAISSGGGLIERVSKKWNMCL